MENKRQAEILKTTFTSEKNFNSKTDKISKFCRMFQKI